MAERVSAEEREHLLEELRSLIERRGAETFLAAPIREPTPQDFPDPFEPTAGGVEVLLRRVMAYAGLGALPFRLHLFSAPEEIRELSDRGERRRWGHDGAAAWFAGIEDGCCLFGVREEGIGEPVALVATLCHEVAHAWRHNHGLVEEDRELEEMLTDLTTVYMGVRCANDQWGLRLPPGRRVHGHRRDQPVEPRPRRLPLAGVHEPPARGAGQGAPNGMVGAASDPRKARGQPGVALSLGARAAGLGRGGEAGARGRSLPLTAATWSL